MSEEAKKGYIVSVKTRFVQGMDGYRAPTPADIQSIVDQIGQDDAHVEKNEFLKFWIKATEDGRKQLHARLGTLCDITRNFSSPTTTTSIGAAFCYETEDDPYKLAPFVYLMD